MIGVIVGCHRYLRGHLNFDSAGYPPEKHRAGTGHEYVGGDMLKPREADIPALFLVLVVLPLVTYIILGKWSEAAKKKARISMLAQLAAEEAHRVETLATATVVPAASSPKTGFHFCARCSSPATTRCARCKSVRYCSGKCQIVHWRQGHKQECQQLDNSDLNTSANLASVTKSVFQKVLLDESPNSPFFGSDIGWSMPHDRISPDSWVSHKINGEILTDDDIASHDSFKETISSSSTTSVPRRKKVGSENHTASSDEIPINQNNNRPPMSVNGHNVTRNTMHPPYKLTGKNGSVCESNNTSNISGTLYSDQNERNASEIEMNAAADKEIPQKTAYMTNPAQCSNGFSKTADTKNVGLKKLPKIPRRVSAGRTSDSLKKIKVLFPFEEFVKLFHCEVWDLYPRGLLNCGNSCYANAVLQCLTCTKPLIIYLLQRSHSRACWANNDCCLICELEQHASMLRDGRGPLSPIRILSLMRNISSQMGGGDQEDAHEFLRLLVTSMQSKCLEGLGGEKGVDAISQETTLIQQIFGGRLRSKVKCLRCDHESERYENIMDLTLEIFGWVESLEDALTQFTAPEDLDGENMYRCGRCAKYVKARKQLSIHEAPNILTIVLKRFQTGKYGKINKCITFPDMLDMIPFMTGNSDSPPLYMLYGVVVHLDTLNASFSGHYVSYVKDLQGTWFRIDDTEVEPVPMSRVMSEGAYILFYSRSYPRPPRVFAGRTAPLKASPYEKHCTFKTQRLPSRQEQSKQNDFLLASDDPLQVPAANMGNFHCVETNTGTNYRATDHGIRSSYGNVHVPTRQTYTDSSGMDFSDATSSSDWSLFTSSDESSFTTESTRDSFSTVDYSDPFNMDPIFSIFNSVSIPEYTNSSVSCTKFLPCRPLTRFFSESRGFVVDSSMSTQPLCSVHNGRSPERVTASLTESLASSANKYSYVCEIGE
ncbi:hypothetical protein MRB53_036031 [Persea americana]|uniref:Uncharacterized protein n=1 Tax=Persea americana TaxID=3435 RepID=A0ACC2K6A7_PERAE|nr:hypothetical protein MRB53_036031 [Persea americana]